jgi:DNA transformation protein
MKNTGEDALTCLPNIGQILAQKMEKAGIESANDLRNIGSEQALIRIATLSNSGACLNMLYALEGAIQGIRWHGLTAERKLELKEAYHLLNIKS